MRALLDTNILISYLLTGRGDSIIASVVRAGVLGAYILLLPEELLDELARKAHEKDYLRQRIAAQDLNELAAILAQVAQVAEAVPKITDVIPAVTRDPEDDYLLAYALVGQADYLVMGDRGLLVLEQVGDTRIVTARDFLGLLEGL